MGYLEKSETREGNPIGQEMPNLATLAARRGRKATGLFQIAGLPLGSLRVRSIAHQDYRFPNPKKGKNS